MRLNDSTLSDPNFTPRRKRSLSDFTAVQKQWAAHLRKLFSKGLTLVMIGRMQSVLQSMTDEQLNAVGVERRNIRRHAEYLIT